MREETPHDRSRPEETDDIVVEGKGTVALGDAEDVLAAVPGCLESFSSSIEPAVRSCLVKSAAAQLQRVARSKSRAVLHLPNHLDWLLATRFTREDTRQIRYVVETFYNVEPVHAVMTACALEWVTGRLVEVQVSDQRQCARMSAVVNGRIELADDRNPPDCLLPFVGRRGRPCHSFFRALAVWPDYLDRVGDDLDRFVKADEFALAVETLREAARGMCRDLPVSNRPPGLHGNCSDLRDTLDRCLSLSCEVILICCSLRRGFINAEKDARSRGANPDQS